MVLSGGMVSFHLSNLGFLVIDVASPAFLARRGVGGVRSPLLSFLLSCFVRGFSHHIVSVQLFVGLFIKQDKSLF
jgi:hypothetical protein